MSILRPHRHHIERQSEHIGGRDRSDHCVGVGQRMGHRLRIARETSALPDYGVRITVGSDVRWLVETREESKKVSAVGFRARNVHEVEHSRILHLWGAYM